MVFEFDDATPAGRDAALGHMPTAESVSGVEVSDLDGRAGRRHVEQVGLLPARWAPGPGPLRDADGVGDGPRRVAATNLQD